MAASASAEALVPCRNATSVAWLGTVSRTPGTSPNSADEIPRGGVPVRDGDRDVIDALDLDHGLGG